MSDSRFQPVHRPSTPPASRRRRFAPGEILMRQGDPGHSAWLIESGDVDVILERPGDKPVRLSHLSRGALVGEMALIDQGPRSATVRAANTVVATELGHETFRRMIDTAPPLANYILTSLLAAIRRLYGIPPCERSEGSGDIRSQHNYARVLNRRPFREGHCFFKEGELASHVYLIQSGRIGIVQGGTRIAELGAGRLFGELGVLLNVPRAGTALALEQTTCEIILRSDVEQVIGTLPPILRTLTRFYAGQVARSRPGHAAKPKAEAMVPHVPEGEMPGEMDDLL